MTSAKQIYRLLILIILCKGRMFTSEEMLLAKFLVFVNRISNLICVIRNSTEIFNSSFSI